MQSNINLGENSPFNFFQLEEPFHRDNSSIVEQIKKREIDGVIAKSILTLQEVAEVKSFLIDLQENLYMTTPSGKIFPKPFAVINGERANQDAYAEYVALLDNYKLKHASIHLIFKKLNEFISNVASKYKVSSPTLKLNKCTVAEGTFRYLYPNKGGLYVHSGNYFQEQNEFFYSMLEEDIDMDNQLSYFIVLQNAEQGGELTLYDLIWEKGQIKDTPLNNEFVLDKEGKKIIIKDLINLKLRPQPGDLLMFYGGYIWHRVEDIEGNTPRITLGGFLNFSKDDQELYYWS